MALPARPDKMLFSVGAEIPLSVANQPFRKAHVHGWPTEPSLFPQPRHRVAIVGLRFRLRKQPIWVRWRARRGGLVGHRGIPPLLRRGDHPAPPDRSRESGFAG